MHLFLPVKTLLLSKGGNETICRERPCREECNGKAQGISHGSKQPCRVSLQEHEASCSHAPPFSYFRLKSAFKSLFAEYLFNCIVTFQLIGATLVFAFNPSLLLSGAFWQEYILFMHTNQPVSISLLLKPFEYFLNLKILDPPKVTLRQARR